MKIIPTVLAENMKDFKKRFDNLLPAADEIQIDLMDGRFVETKSISLEEVPDVKKLKNGINWAIKLMTTSTKPLIGKMPLISANLSRKCLSIISSRFLI